MTATVALPLAPSWPKPWVRQRRQTRRRWLSPHLALVIPLIAIIGQIRLPDSEATSETSNRGIRVFGATGNEREVIIDAYRSYVDAGLDLPASLRIEVSDQPGLCGGFDGVYTYQAHRVVLCRAESGDWRFLRKLVVHELAHAWDDHNMNAERRDAYLSHLGLDPSTKWFGRTSLTINVPMSVLPERWGD